MTKIILTFALCLITCSVFAQQIYSERIIWPANFEPSASKFYVHNEIEINASSDLVWLLLIDALSWPSWYNGAKNVSYVNLHDKVINGNSIIKWETMGLKFESTIKQFEPPHFLAWESKKKSIQGYHVWLIIPTEMGCKVITDESQNGWLTFFEKVFQSRKLKKLHDVWLLELKRKAENKL